MLEQGTQHISHIDERMAGVIKIIGPCTLSPQRYRFQSLVRAIVGQQISTKAARSVFNRLRAEAGGYVTAERIGALKTRQLRSVGLSDQKTKYISDLSRRVTSGTLRLDKLDVLDDDAVVAALTEVKGIGPWTAEMFMMFVLNRPDILPMADLGIQEGFRRIYKLRKRPSEERMLQLAKPWQPYRTIGSWYLWRHLDAVPEDY